MAKSKYDGPVFSLQLALDTNEKDACMIEQSFVAIARIHNILVKHAKKLLRMLNRDENYQRYLKEYGKVNSMLEKTDLDMNKKCVLEKRKKELQTTMNEIRDSLNLSQSGLDAYVKVAQKKYRRLISSHIAQKEVSRVWKGVHAVLFKNGKDIHYKKVNDFRTICAKTNGNGIIFDKDEMVVRWNKRVIPVKTKLDAYKLKALQNEISYCEIKRLMFSNGWHYYVDIYLRGVTPKEHTIGTCVAGIDPGMSTMAYVSDNKVMVAELAPKSKDYNKEIAKLQRKADRKRRMNNPGNFQADGTPKKSTKNHRLTWKNSQKYKWLMNRIKELYRKKAATIKESHELLANQMIENASFFYVEKMNYKALGKKAKKTERKDKVEQIKTSTGETKSIKKYKRKKRLGKSLNDRAPSQFLAILQRKCKQYGLPYFEIHTKDFRASQYDHVLNTYIKVSLSTRFKQVGNYLVQRDLYSAFLILHTYKNLKKPNRKRCIKDFKAFMKLHDEWIASIKQQNISLPACVGI